MSYLILVDSTKYKSYEEANKTEDYESVCLDCDEDSRMALSDILDAVYATAKFYKQKYPLVYIQTNDDRILNVDDIIFG